MPHPDEGLIHAWLDGELDEAEAARVEALVASDPAWGAAAAEARGLIAASARIVGALDRVPANVIPVAAPLPRKGVGRWVLRAAAALVLVAGSAVVLQRGTPELPAPKPAREPVLDHPPVPPPVVAVPQAKNQPAVSAAKKTGAVAQLQRSDSQTTPPSKVLDASKQAGAPADKDVAAAATESRANAVSAGAAAAAPAGAAGAGLGARRVAAPQAALAKSFAEEQRVTRLPASCFQQREPRDSAMRMIRLEAAALNDSIRLERLVQRGDTLAAVNGPLIAVRVPCPRP